MKTKDHVHYLRGKTNMSMTEMHEGLLTAILEEGLEHVAATCNVSTSEASRKIAGETGFKLSQLADLFDSLGLRVVNRGDVVLAGDEYHALVVSAKQQLDARYAALSVANAAND